MTTGTPKAARRPGVVTFISVVIVVQAVLDAVAAVLMFVRMNNDEFQAKIGLTSTEMLWTGIGYAAVRPSSSPSPAICARALRALG